MLQLENLLKIRTGVLILGQANSGKSTLVDIIA